VVNGVTKNRLSEILFHMNISQARLADGCEISRNTISKIVNNRTEPSLDVLLRISRYLCVDVNDIFCLEDNDFDTTVEDVVIESGMRAEFIKKSYWYHNGNQTLNSEIENKLEEYTDQTYKYKQNILVEAKIQGSNMNPDELRSLLKDEWTLREFNIKFLDEE
jgi:putative transcriptional regulator